MPLTGTHSSCRRKNVYIPDILCSILLKTSAVGRCSRCLWHSTYRRHVGCILPPEKVLQSVSIIVRLAHGFFDP
jgi:hypothetical protein